MGVDHYNTAREVQRVLQRYKDLQDIIAILGMEELSEADKELVARSQNSEISFPAIFVAEQFTGTKGAYVPLAETIRSFKEILDGKHDDKPEGDFYMKGTLKFKIVSLEKQSIWQSFASELLGPSACARLFSELF